MKATPVMTQHLRLKLSFLTLTQRILFKSSLLIGMCAILSFTLPIKYLYASQQAFGRVEPSTNTTLSPQPTSELLPADVNSSPEAQIKLMSIAGQIQIINSKRYLQQIEEPHHRYAVFATSSGVRNDLDKLMPGDRIHGTGNIVLDSESNTRIVMLHSIESVGLRRFLGTWRTVQMLSSGTSSSSNTSNTSSSSNKPTSYANTTNAFGYAASSSTSSTAVGSGSINSSQALSSWAELDTFEFTSFKDLKLSSSKWSEQNTNAHPESNSSSHASGHTGRRTEDYAYNLFPGDGPHNWNIFLSGKEGIHYGSITLTPSILRLTIFDSQGGSTVIDSQSKSPQQFQLAMIQQRPLLEMTEKTVYRDNNPVQNETGDTL